MHCSVFRGIFIWKQEELDETYSLSVNTTYSPSSLTGEKCLGKVCNSLVFELSTRKPCFQRPLSTDCQKSSQKKTSVITDLEYYKGVFQSKKAICFAEEMQHEESAPKSAKAVSIALPPFKTLQERCNRCKEQKFCLRCFQLWLCQEKL